ncbi:hypothetical protein I317_05586 [Kwoniella heveanensis CBS 569]|nr:hypothetical protein I317_05586 [Kwoniella heveanensis CBS 569]
MSATSTKACGPTYKLQLLDEVVFTGDYELVRVLCDQTKFEKKIPRALMEVRAFAGDGLFTSFGRQEKNWNIAHRILLPAFGPLAIKKMQPQMMEMITQMLLHWEHHAGQPFEAAEAYTRLTFDTIGWCAFKYRFNLFHTENMHPFIEKMSILLAEAGNRARRPELLKKVMYRSEAEYWANIKILHDLCDEIVAQRRKNPDPEAKDLLNNMIYDVDPQTGEHLSDENIRYQMVTFLIAGHETTSGMLSFATYFMLKHPETFVKARKEADQAIADAGGNLLEIKPAKLVYTDAILKEALRLQPTVAVWTVAPTSAEGETLPGGYKIQPKQTVGVILPMLHRDPKIWGNDAEAFRPERWIGWNPPTDAYKPFGNGERACIGRGFAIQEALLALALVVNRFDLEMADPNYEFAIKQALTVKPKDFRIIARPRRGKPQSLMSDLLHGSTISRQGSSSARTADETWESGGRKITFLYGSNSGSCEGLARELASEGRQRGFKTTVGELDRLARDARLPTDQPVIICTASYEGQPTDNARAFVESIRSMSGYATLKGVNYAVFGAGHHDWVATFHKIPTFIDTRLSELGATRLLELSKADAGGDIVGDFEAFKTKVWDHFGKNQQDGAAYAASAVQAASADTSDKPRVRILPPSTNPVGSFIGAGIDGIGEILDQMNLVQASEINKAKNCITIRLPEGQSYATGDYLALLPNNPSSIVDRALKAFQLDADAWIALGSSISFLPANQPIRAAELLGSFVEVSQPASKRTLETMFEANQEPKVREALESLVDNYAEIVTSKRMSLLDIVESIPGLSIDLSFFLENLPRMKIRQYSISSSPLEDPNVVTLTYEVLRADSLSGRGEYFGVASNYLCSLKKGDKLSCSIKQTGEFHPPLDPAVPIVMFAAGSGIAPFRGFIAERVLQKRAGRQVGEIILYYGCRGLEDICHVDELVQWAKEGHLDYRPVFSRSPSTTTTGLPVDWDGKIRFVEGTKHVQDRVWQERPDIRRMYEKGAIFYTCGSGAKLAADLKKTLIEVLKEGTTIDEDEANGLAEKLSKERYKTDVFL